MSIQKNPKYTVELVIEVDRGIDTINYKNTSLEERNAVREEQAQMFIKEVLDRLNANSNTGISFDVKSQSIKVVRLS